MYEKQKDPESSKGSHPPGPHGDEQMVEEDKPDGHGTQEIQVRQLVRGAVFGELLRGNRRRSPEIFRSLSALFMYHGPIRTRGGD
jgi:hypothetical protein